MLLPFLCIVSPIWVFCMKKNLATLNRYLFVNVSLGSQHRGVFNVLQNRNCKLITFGSQGSLLSWFLLKMNSSARLKRSNVCMYVCMYVCTVRSPGLPDFSGYNMPRPEKYTK
jgi:hypothetical protein